MEKTIKFEFEYSTEDDVLTIYDYNKKPFETVEFSEFLNISLDKDRLIVGMEIIDASSFFGVFDKGVNKEFLENLDGVDLEQVEIRNTAFVVVCLRSADKLVKRELPPMNFRGYESPLVTSL